MNSLLFVLSKLFWDVLHPSSLLLLLLSAGAFLIGGRFLGAGRLAVATSAVCLLAIAALPVGDGLMAPLEDRFPAVRIPPPHVDGIIVLGGAIDLDLSGARRMPSLNSAAERMTTFAALARRYPDARLVFSGGSNLLEQRALREADVARTLLADLGVDVGRVVFERNSRNTYENAVFSKELVHPGRGETWILVTSAAHMPRAAGVFRRIGWPVLPWPTAYKTSGEWHWAHGLDLAGGLDKVDGAAHEWAGLAYYRLLGRTDRLFPAP
ncbi:MAG: YdcF family protein [Magnetospirillum sp.]|nr:YdcF family protein [Magnetospirillum sp.]